MAEPHEKRREILRDYLAGEKLAYICAVHACSKNAPKRMAARHGYVTRKTGRPPKRKVTS
jgi:hypothetical protein